MSNHASPSEYNANSIYQKFWKYAVKNCIPENVVLELTLNCNFNCKHCYNYDRTKKMPEKFSKDLMSHEDILRVITEISKAGGLYLSFTGGEAFLHPKLFEYIEHAKKEHLAVGLKSNGALLTEDKIIKLKEAGVCEVEVSLYGGSEASHDKFTGTKGTFHTVLNNIKLLKKYDLNPNVNIIIHKGNYKELEFMRDFCREVGANYACDYMLTKRYDDTEDSLSQRLNANEIREMLAGPAGDEFLGRIDDVEKSNMQCSCARTNCGITSQGIVYPCFGAPIPSGNIKEQNFVDIWKHSPEFQKIRGLVLDDFSDCKACDKRAYCFRSSGSTYINTGDYTGSDPWVCENTEILKEFNT